MDGSPPGSSALGILQARILEWVAVPSSRGSSQPRDPAHIFYVHLLWQAGPLPLAAPGKPMESYAAIKKSEEALRFLMGAHFQMSSVKNQIALLCV